VIGGERARREEMVPEATAGDLGGPPRLKAWMDAQRAERLRALVITAL
jgi:hypothetical protein